MVSVKAEQKFVMPSFEAQDKLRPASRFIPGPNTNTAMDSGMRRNDGNANRLRVDKFGTSLLETKGLAK